MPIQVVNTAQLACSFGAAPSTLTVLPVNRVNCGNQPAANIMDHVPMVNIMPFGLCSAPTNPVVISATAAKAGVFTPAPCTPATPSPWVPGAVTANIANQPALDNVSKCTCTWLGIISVVSPGQTQTNVP
jgi:hypothetical protein